MRIKRLFAAALAAAAVYSSTVFVASLPATNTDIQLSIQKAAGVRVAVAAATLEETCGSYSSGEKLACEYGYKGAQNNLNLADSCQPVPEDMKSVCQRSYEAIRPPPAEPATEEQCADRQGALAFIVCPVFDKVAETVTDALGDIIKPMLVVKPLEVESDLYKTWDAIRVLANVAFVIIFVVIIFANTLQFNLSAYQIRTILPRLVAAAILVQLSFLISAMIVDAGNVLGEGIVQIINQATGNGGGEASAGNGVLNTFLAIVAGLGIASLAVVFWPLVFPLILILIIALAAFVLTLAVRYFLIGVLIIVSPLAFAAWVLPNTQQYFSRWLKTLVKLVLMYPIIAGLLALAANVSTIVPNASEATASGATASAGVGTSLIKLLIFIALLAAVPQTFKWAGGIMAEFVDKLDDAAEKGWKAVRKSHRYEKSMGEAKLRSAARGEKVANWLNDRKVLAGDGKVKSALRSGLTDAGGILLAGRGSNSAYSRENDHASVINRQAKEIGELRGGNSMMNQRRALLHYYYRNIGDTDKAAENYEGLADEGALSLLDYTKHSAGRQAIMRRLADNNLTGPEIGNAIKAFGHPADAYMLSLENGKNLGKSPGLFARYNHVPDSGETNPLGQQAKLLDVNERFASSFLSSQTPERIKGEEFKVDNFHLGANNKPGSSAVEIDISKQWTKVMAQELDLVPNFDPKDRRTFMAPDKRAATLMMMARNPDEFRMTERGRKQYDEILDLVKSNKDANSSALHLIDKEKDAADIRAKLGL